MKRVFWAILPAICVSAASVSWAAGTWKLNLNGASVSTSAKIIGGKTYVPVDDVAKALGMKATVAGTNITLRPAGGTFQIANKLQGKMGEELFSGKWGFKVVSVERGSTYASKFRNTYNNTQSYDAKAGEELVIVHCRLKNGTKNTENFAFSAGDYGRNTSLTDMDAGSYKPDSYDVFAEESAPLGKSALPGASIPFAIVFRVPQGTPLKDLVYSVVPYRERGDNKSTDFRVALNS